MARSTIHRQFPCLRVTQEEADRATQYDRSNIDSPAARRAGEEAFRLRFSPDSPGRAFVAPIAAIVAAAGAAK